MKIHRLDTSEYSKGNVYKIALVNKEELVRMEEENNGRIMLEFIELRSKMNVIRPYHETIKKIKEIKYCAVEEIRIEAFLHRLYHSTLHTVTRNSKSFPYLDTMVKEIVIHSQRIRYVGDIFNIPEVPIGSQIETVVLHK